MGKSYNSQPQEDAILIDSERKVRLGELLVDSGVVSSADLTEAIQVSTRLNIPIGRVLLLSGLVSPVTLEAALEAQPLLNQNQESRENVIQALKEVDQTGRSLDRTLTNPHATNKGIGLGKDKLAELLLDSEIVSQDQLDQALSTSFEAGVPLGSALVLEGILSPSLFPSILQIQQKVRTGSISKDEAIEEVKSTFMHWLKAEESLSGRSFGTAETETETEPELEIEPTAPESAVEAEESTISITFEPESRLETGTPRLIDLLIESGRFKKADVDKAFNRVLANPQKSAELFELLGLINHETMKDAIKCQSLIKRGHLSRKEARYVLDTSLSEPLEVEEKKLKPYFDRDYRKSVFSKVMGGMVVGAAVAGLSILKSRGK